MTSTLIFIIYKKKFIIIFTLVSFQVFGVKTGFRCKIVKLKFDKWQSRN